MSITFKKFTIDNLTWTAFAPDTNVNYAILKNGSSSPVKIRTSSGDSNTEDTLPAGAQESMQPVHDPISQWRFLAGQGIIYMQAVTAGTFTVVGKFTT